MFWVAQLCWLNKICEWNWKFEAWERIVWPKLEIGNRNPLNNTSFAPSLASFPMNPGVNPASPVPLSHKAATFGLWDRSLEYLRRSFECPRGTPFRARPIINGKFESWFAGGVSGGQAKLSSNLIRQSPSSPSSLSSAKSRAFLKSKLTTVWVGQDSKKKTLPWSKDGGFWTFANETH